MRWPTGMSAPLLEFGGAACCGQGSSSFWSSRLIEAAAAGGFSFELVENLCYDASRRAGAFPGDGL